MQKRESKFSILFRHWIKANPQITCSFEMKQTTKNSIPFSCLEDRQLDYGVAIRGDRGVLIRVQGVNGEPDYIYMRKAPSYVVIKFPKEFHMISIAVFIQEKLTSKRKSLTNMRARELSTISVKY